MISITECPHCQARFEIPRAKLNRFMVCEGCGEKFRAAPSGAQPSAKANNAAMYAAVGGGTLLVCLLIYAMVRNRAPDEEPKPAPPPVATKAPPPPEPERTPQQQALEVAKKAIAALHTPDDPALPECIDAVRRHRWRQEQGKETKTWSQLGAEEQFTRQEEFVGELVGDEAQQAFNRAATVGDVEYKNFAPPEAELHLALKSAAANVTQNVTVFLAQGGDGWKLYRLERGPIEDHGLPPEPPPPSAVPKGRRLSEEADVAKVPLPPGISASTAASIEAALGDLKDLDATVKANRSRQALVKIGKPAIPYLLNALADVDFNDEKHLLVGTRIADALGDITGVTYAIAPGGVEGSMIGARREDNERNRRRWFGWWRDNGGTFTARPAAEDPLGGPKKDG